jgi:transposase
MQEVIPMKKNPYSLVPVNAVDLHRLIEHRRGQTATVGIDVAKQKHAAGMVWPDGSFEKPWEIKSPSQVRLLVNKLLELKQDCPVVVAMESSGTYGDPLRQALTDAQIEVRRVSAKAVKDYCETFDGVSSQHDGKDAPIIGTLCVAGKSRPWPWRERREADLQLRYWVRTLDTAQRIKQVWCGKLESMLARHWPEAGRLLRQSGATLPKALMRWGDPAALAADPKAAELLARFGGRYLSAEKIVKLIESARTTIGVRMSPWTARELRETAAAILEQRQRIQHCRRELKKLTKNHQVLQRQAPALGLTTACVLWMCLGDANNYPSAAAYRKAMGLNLKERSSGMLKGKLSLSKRGQRLTRKWLYFSALRWMREPSVKLWIDRKKQRDGGRGDKAATGVMRRLALAAWHLGRGRRFDPTRLFSGTRRLDRRGKEVTSMR